MNNNWDYDQCPLCGSSKRASSSRCWSCYKAWCNDIPGKFWEKVQKTDSCWLWLGAKSKTGYGSFGGPDGTILAHRFAWILANGPVPDDMCILHRCDNPPCVRNDSNGHLFLGSQQDNVSDCIEKNRHSTPPRLKGDLHPHAVLNETLVRLIRAEAATGVRRTDIARMLGVDKTTINRVVNRQTWTHII